ncbi:MAG: alpha-L-rhamnosidase C-terminal domain-containing protein, partial [Acidobacteriota bacterium]
MSGRKRLPWGWFLGAPLLCLGLSALMLASWFRVALNPFQRYYLIAWFESGLHAKRPGDTVEVRWLLKSPPMVLWMAAAGVPSRMPAQMGDPADGPTKIPIEQLDAARNAVDLTLESAVHTPLPEQYIWTTEDAVPSVPTSDKSWGTGKGQDLDSHYFRRTFTLSRVPGRAEMYVAGPRQATIYVNGRKVGRYQLDLSFPMGIRVYAFDVTKALQAGSNVVAIEAIRGPRRGVQEGNRLGAQQIQGKVMAMKIVPAALGVSAAPLLISDANWKASMRLTPGWQNPGFNDSGWSAADCLGGVESSLEFFQWNADAGMYAWPGYDGISPFLGHYSLRAASVQDVYNGSGKIAHPEALTLGGEDLRVTLPAGRLTKYQAPSILLDFRREVAGRLEFDSDVDTPMDVTVQYGESEMEALSDPYLGVDPVHLAANGTAYGPKSAFRYALVRFVGGRQMNFKAIRLDGIAYPVNYQGYFDSSDKQLNLMWAIGAYTAHLCMQDDIWDGPKRDRGRWMADLDVSGRTIEDAFGGNFLMDDTLDHLLGTNPVRSDVNGIPGYSAFWLTGEKEYFLHTGSMKQLQQTHARMVQLLNYMELEMNRRNLFADKNHAWTFVDWSPELSGDTPLTRMATQFEFYAAFKDGAYLLRQLNDDANARKFAAEAQKLKTAAQQYLQDSSGSYGDRWQTNAYAVLSGVADPAQYPAIWKDALSTVGHIKYNPFIITPYYNYYVVSAMAKMGHRQSALNWIRQYWGGMTQEGATSFWEGYDPAWYKGVDFHASLQADNMSGYRVSLAHGWSSGVTPWLMEQVIGIKATGPGFSTVNIRPDLLDLSWAEGGEPTPRGMLKVSIHKQDGYTTEVDLPAATTATVSVPVSGATS